MKIAIIGWGSLIWCPGSLQIKSAWHLDGPILPIEFARISKDGRLTLVIHSGSAGQRTLWAPAVVEDMSAVLKNLQDREGTPPRFIHSGTADGQFSDGVTQEVRDVIAKWLEERQDIRGCVWTGLATNWKDKQKSDFSVQLAIQYLKDLPDPARAREYIQNTPEQIQTAVRAAAREHLHWCDAVLSPTLFAAD
jgi:hypothetical protein